MNDRRQRVVIVEDHPLMRRAVEELLQESGYEVVGAPEGISAGLDCIERNKPDVVIVDLSLAREDGCELIRTVRQRWPQVPVAVFSMHADHFHVETAFRSGAKAYVAKSELAGTLLEALREVLAGRTFLSPRLVPIMVRRWVDSGESPEADDTNVLSPKERQVFEMFGMGFSVREIAVRLKRSHKTVETYCARIKKKLGISSNRDLLRHAIDVARGDPPTSERGSRE